MFDIVTASGDAAPVVSKIASDKGHKIEKVDVKVS